MEIGIAIGLLLLRLFAGLQLAAHGTQKLAGWFGGFGIDGVGNFFQQLGLRPGKFMAVLAGLGELVGGLMLALGLLSPLAAAIVIAVMLTATTTVHLGKGFFAERGGFELPLLIAAVAASIGFAGAGAFSLDAAIGWHFAGWETGIFSVAAGVVGMLVAQAMRTTKIVERAKQKT